MKKYLPNPHLLLMGFSLFIIIGSMSSVKAQDEKRIVRSIIIMNGDTIINGQKLSEAKKEDRVRLRKELKDMGQDMDGLTENSVTIKKRNSKEPLVLHWKDEKSGDAELELDNHKNGDLRIFKFNGKDMDIDSLMNGFGFKIDGLDSNLRQRGITTERNFRQRQPGMGLRLNPERPALRSPFYESEDMKNTSSFSYSYFDKDGIPSKMNISISDIEKDHKEKITGSKDENDDLKVEDLTLFPNFSSGKLGISFNTSSNTPLKLKILNSDFKQVFSDDASTVSGNYTKQISLPKNGIYYIAIKQNNNWFLRKLIKS
jgi:hypothetical protein